MPLMTSAFCEQSKRWPQTGRHILAQFDDDSVVVYQAYRPSIGHFAAEHGYFGGEFQLSRMSWIKPNFLWMMYRSGWGSKEGQEVVLAVRLQRSAFDEILSQAVPSTFDPAQYADHESWQSGVRQSDVRLQWDPDHDPNGLPVERRAIQLGLRGNTLARYAKEWLLGIEEISDLVQSQHRHVLSGNFGDLLTPTEQVYPVVRPVTRRRLGMTDG